MNRFLAISLLFAASTVVAEQGLSDELYLTPAGYWFSIEQCGLQGRISPKAASFGKQMMRDARSQFDFNPTQFEQHLAELAAKHTKGINPKLCNLVRMEIDDIRKKGVFSAATEQAGAQVKAQLKQQQRKEAPEAAQLELQRLREALATAELELQRQREAKAAAQLEQERQRATQAETQLEQQRQRAVQAEAQLEQQRQQQILQANAADERREREKIDQQINQMGQQFRDFGNSMRTRQTDCTRTMGGVSCTTY